MNLMTKLGIAVVILLGALGTGYWYGSGKKEVVTVEKEVVRTETQWKDRIVTVIRTVKPDGTVTEETKTEEREGSKTKQKDRTDTKTEPALAQYSLGLQYGFRYSGYLVGDFARPDLGQAHAVLGRRILGPFWGEIGLGLKEVTVGMRYEF